MRSQDSVSRRRFIASSAGAFGSGWLALNWPNIVLAAEHAHARVAEAADAPDRLEHLSADQARDVEALAAEIIPTTATAGAREAGVVFFIDRALTTFFASRAGEFRAGLNGFQAAVRAQHGDTASFARLTEPERLAATQAAATSPFFQAMRMLTILGFLTLPSYGGNRDRLGWQAVGFTDEHAFAPPFGYYDRDYPGFEPYPPLETKDPS